MQVVQITRNGNPALLVLPKRTEIMRRAIVEAYWRVLRDFWIGCGVQKAKKVI